MAGLKSSNAGLIIRVTRALMGLCLGAALWALWGWAVWGWALAYAMLSWCLVLGPLFFLTLLFFRHPFFRRNVFRMDLNRNAAILKEYFELLLAEPGPQPVFFVTPSRDKTVTWLNVPFSSKQHVYVASAWLEQDKAVLRQQLKRIWSEMASMTPLHRWFRSVEWAFWCSLLLPLEIVLWILDGTLSFFGLRGVPSSRFWGQRLCWKLKRVWFWWPGKQESDDRAVFEVAKSQSGRVVTPECWMSLTWGVWTRLVPDQLHPSWAILTDSEAIL